MITRAMLHRDGRRTSQVRQRVHLGQIDFNRHMNQAEYPRVFELGRTDLLLRSGAWRTWRAAGLNPVMAEQFISYRRELGPLATYSIDSRIVGTEGRFLVVQGHILVGEVVHTRGLAKLLFVGPDGVLDAGSVAALAAPWLTTPLAVENWRVVDQA